MSLQVWLPLNGNLDNQGLNGVTFSGSPSSWSSGKIGKCATFAGNAANVIYNNTTAFNYTDNFSWAVWVNTNYTGTTPQYVFTNGRADYGGYGYCLQCVSATTCTVRFGSSSWNIPVSGGQWTHIVFTKSGTAIKIYINGSLHTSATFSGTVPTYSDGNGLGVGCFHYSSNIYPFYGSINDVRVYDHCLSEKEIKELAKGLCLHYTLDGGLQESTIEYDCSGFGNNGTKTGSIATSTDTAHRSASYQFENGKYITGPSPAHITSGSCSFWAKYETLGSSGWLPVTGDTTSKYFMATSGGTGNFYNGTVTASPAITYYEDGFAVTKPSSNGVWHHYCITGINLSSWTAFKINNYSTVWNSTCKLSDFRFYSTVLSADDVKELYHTAASIDNKGNLFCGEVCE